MSDVDLFKAPVLDSPIEWLSSLSRRRTSFLLIDTGYDEERFFVRR